MELSIPTFASLQQLFQDEIYCLNYLKTNDFLIVFCNTYFFNCVKVNGLKNYDCRPILMKCSNSYCKTSISIYSTTLFSGSHLKCNKLLELCYLWISHASSEFAAIYTGYSNVTIINWYSTLREFVSIDLNIDEDNVKIGGQGVVVYRDEDINNLNMHHLTVNHSINFVDPQTGIYLVIFFINTFNFLFLFDRCTYKYYRRNVECH